MIVRLSEAEMLAHYKRMLGMVTPDGVTVVPAAGEDIDAMLTTRMRATYAAMLRTAPARLLPQKDVREEAQTRYLDDTSCEILFPDCGVRPVSISVAEWTVPVVNFTAPDSDEARTQADTLLRATSIDPLVVEYPDRLIVYGVVRQIAIPDFDNDREGLPVNPSLKQPRITELRMVVRPDDGVYEMDEELLGSFADYTINL